MCLQYNPIVCSFCYKKFAPQDQKLIQKIALMLISAEEIKGFSFIHFNVYNSCKCYFWATNASKLGHKRLKIRNFTECVEWVSLQNFRFLVGYVWCKQMVWKINCVKMHKKLDMGISAQFHNAFLLLFFCFKNIHEMYT